MNMWWILWVVMVVPAANSETVKTIKYPLQVYTDEAECGMDKEMMKFVAVDLATYSCEGYGET